LFTYKFAVENQLTMKNYKLLLGLFASVSIFYSCSNDDDVVTEDVNATIIGRWIYSQQGFAAGGQEQLSNYAHRTGCNKDYIKFDLDRKFYEIEYLNGCVIDTIGKGTFDRDNNNNLTLIYDNAPTDRIVYRIESTATTLKTTTETTFEGQPVNVVTTYTKN